jgi:hypothetical protein
MAPVRMTTVFVRSMCPLLRPSGFKAPQSIRRMGSGCEYPPEPCEQARYVHKLPNCVCGRWFVTDHESLEPERACRHL